MLPQHPSELETARGLPELDDDFDYAFGFVTLAQTLAGPSPSSACLFNACGDKYGISDCNPPHEGMFCESPSLVLHYQG